jgi:uncharacterized protein (DUF2235 family)
MVSLVMPPDLIGQEQTMENRKNIVLCSDGTGNTMMKGRGTNVWKLYEAVDLTAHRWHQGGGDRSILGKEQIAFYDDGVGSQNNKILKIVGGAFGFGLKRNIRDLYKSLCRAYRPGDDIYIFGFSRGAYTARVLAGLILSCGILRHKAWQTDRQLDDLSKLAYEKFRSHFKLGTTKGKQANKAFKRALEAAQELEQAGKEASEPMTQRVEATREAVEKANKDLEAASKKAEKKTDEFRREHSVLDDTHAPDGQVSIRFIGVWDTVAAVGLPFRGLSKLWNRFVYPFMFPDYLLSPRVEKGCHALSIDDERVTFHPMMWDERGQKTSGTSQVEQVWFAGVHSNVGGGYPKQGISLVALDWMMHRAEEKGLNFICSEKDRYRHLQNVHDKLYDSRSGLAMYYRYRPRNIKKICREFRITPKIHISALERIALGTQDYAPGNLPGDFKIITTDPDSGATVEDPGKLQDVVMNIAGETASENVDRWIRLRRRIYLIFIAVTLTIVVGFAASFYQNPIRPPLLIYLFLALVSIGLLVIIYAASKLAESKMQKAFAKFWRKKLPEPWW